MDRHLIPRHIVINEVAQTVIHRQLLHQCRTHAHSHCANDLAACSFRIQDASCSTHSEHTPDPNFSRRAMHADLHKMPGKGRLLVLLAQCSEFNALFRCQSAACGGLM